MNQTIHGRSVTVNDVCIYPGPQHGVMSGEHYLPRALGRFDGFEELYDRVCKTCNAAIGERVETEFLRAGPIAVHLRLFELSRV
jgi:hypothetical protein